MVMGAFRIAIVLGAGASLAIAFGTACGLVVGPVVDQSVGGDDATTNACTTDMVRCRGAQPQRCGATGQWEDMGDGPCGVGTYCSRSGDCSPNPLGSCADAGAGRTNCGPGGSGSESCCTSLDVPGGTYGTYYRTYTNDGSGPAMGKADPANVYEFHLDKYLVTVGRFRQFVAAWNDGWRPTDGAGTHTHVPGNALSNSAGGIETGWDATWNTYIGPTDPNLTDPNSCPADHPTWTPSPTGRESLPINCVNWYEAYAFCIMEGGFLPSEAEWEYAAAGGAEQREYPWGSTAPGTACPGSGCEYAIYNCYYPDGSGTCAAGAAAGMTNIAPVGYASLGVSKWGQLDMAGEVWEWTLDSPGPFSEPCTNCAYLPDAAPFRDARGGNFFRPLTPPWVDLPNFPAGGRGDVGFRCARPL
jgi:formylglycine-generating enzyme required for sulfatase activity